jgi:hypothetical protein
VPFVIFPNRRRLFVKRVLFFLSLLCAASLPLGAMRVKNNHSMKNDQFGGPKRGDLVFKEKDINRFIGDRRPNMSRKKMDSENIGYCFTIGKWVQGKKIKNVNDEKEKIDEFCIFARLNLLSKALWYSKSTKEYEKCISLRKFLISILDDVVLKHILKLGKSLTKKTLLTMSTKGQGEGQKKKEKKVEKIIKRFLEIVFDEEIFSIESLIEHFGLSDEKDRYFNPDDISKVLKEEVGIFSQYYLNHKGNKFLKKVPYHSVQNVKSFTVYTMGVVTAINKFFGVSAVIRLKMRVNNSNIKNPFPVICQALYKDWDKNYRSAYTLNDFISKLKANGDREYDSKHAYRILRDYITKDHIDLTSRKNTYYSNYGY